MKTIIEKIHFDLSLKESLILEIAFILFCMFIMEGTVIHVKRNYYHYSTETCLIQVEGENCLITRPNGHEYEYTSDLLKEQRTFSILTFCDNGTPKDFTDDFIVTK